MQRGEVFGEEEVFPLVFLVVIHHFVQECVVVVVVVVDTDDDDEDEEALLKTSEESGKYSSLSSFCNNKVVVQNRYHLVSIRLLHLRKVWGKTRDVTSIFPHNS